MFRIGAAITAAVLMLVTPSFAQSRTPRSSEGINDHTGGIERGTGVESTGKAVRDQSFIGSGGRRGDSGWVGSDPALSPIGPPDAGLNPKQAGPVGETGTGQ
jgi:hypothetical protein